MKRELAKHWLAYTILIIFMTGMTIAFFGAWPNHGLQRVIALGMAAFYFLWGVVTHVKAEHISRRVVAEYAGVSLLAAVLLFFITI